MSESGFDMSAWPGVELVERVAEGNRNEVWRARDRRGLLAVRQSHRSIASLDWELDLLARLEAEGFVVPSVVPTADGRRHADGVVAQRWIDGRPPASEADWRMVADELARLHDVLSDYPQRPDCVAAPELGVHRRSVDADLDAIPEPECSKILKVLGEFTDLPRSVVHGDPGASNLRITEDGRVGFLDWDECRVDATWHDVSNLGIQVLPDEAHGRSQRLSNAWEAANAWIAEPAYARRRLADL